MKEQTREEPKILAAAERQMRTWAWDREHDTVRRAVPAEPPALSTARRVRYITISRETGAGASQIAATVGRKLGWEVLDKNLLDRIADRFRLSRPMLELVDETNFNWAYDVIGVFLDPKIVPHEKYLAHLGRVIRTAARRGNVVLVGRGARFLLPRENGLAVRIIASMSYRAARVMQRLGCDEAKARRYIQEVDHGRKVFVEKFFHHDIADPDLYDLVLSVDRLGQATAADMIVEAASRKEL
jgi:cytidylate kinase